MTSATKTAPRAVNHISFNVTDIEAAFNWYVDLFGFEVLLPPTRIVAGEGEAGQRIAGIASDPNFKACKLAYLATANGVGLELFEFEQPRTEPYADDWEYWRPGLWHFSITDVDPKAAVERVLAAGGSQKTDYFEVPPGSGFQLVFVQDPWGNPIEIMNAAFDRMITAATRG
jgi:catechol 2,3-dioxygenase-like lactoylglutathione lyase family enzyme